MRRAAGHRQRHRSVRPWHLVGVPTIVLAVAACTAASASPSATAPASIVAATAGTPATASAAGATSAATGSSVPSPSGAPGTLGATIALPSPRDVTSAFGSIWVSNGPAATVTRLDPGTAAVQAVVHVPDPASVLSAGDGALFVTSYPGNSLTRIDPATNRATKTISLASAGSGPVGVVAADGYVWVGDHDGTPVTSVAKVDPQTMKIIDVIAVGDDSQAGPQWVVGGAGSIWTDVANLNAVVRIDPRTDRVQATISIPQGCGAEMVATDDAVWVANGGGDGCATAVYRIDPRTNTVAQTIPMDGDTGMLALGPGGLWFGSSPATLGRIDPAAGAVTGRMEIPGAPFGAAVAGGSVWISDRDNEAVYKIDPS
jgi:YVTN family beta-propeller protein